MSEMIERVARALYGANPCEDTGEALDGFQVTPGGPIKWETLLECDWGPEVVDDFRKQARIAIAAMREPTEAMINCSGAYKGDAAWRDDLTRQWRSMIDAAVADTSTDAKTETGA